MLKPSWWLLAAGVAHACSAAAGMSLGMDAADRAYTTYTTHEIKKQMDARFQVGKDAILLRYEARLNEATATRDHLKAELARLRIEQKKLRTKNVNIKPWQHTQTHTHQCRFS